MRRCGGLDVIKSELVQRIAERERISPSAVSQRVRMGGIGAILDSHKLLRRLP